MKTSVLAAFCVIAAHGNAFARIGETEHELVQRYGSPISERSALENYPGLASKTFASKGWQIIVVLMNERSAYETYNKGTYSESDHIRRGGELSKGDIDLVLAANSHGKQWKPVTEIGDFGDRRKPGTYRSPYTLIQAWIIDDGSVSCVQDRFHQVDRSYFDVLRIFSKQYNDYRTDFARKERDEMLRKSGL